MMLQDIDVTIVSNDFVGNVSVPNANFDLGCLKHPVFCMFMMDYRNHVSEKLNGDRLTVRYQFTEEQLAKMLCFGDSVQVIKNGDEFLNRVKKALLSQSIGCSMDLVSYYGFTQVEQLKQIHKDNLRIAFWKRDKYKYQQEYRLVAHTEVDDFLCIDIGDVCDITQLLKSETLLNTGLEVSFAVRQAE